MRVAIQKGFTLVELMVVVAIIGVLSAAAIGAYQDYIGRAQASEGINLLGGGKTPLAEYYADKGLWPGTASDVMSSVSGKYTSSVDIAAGAGSAAPGLTLQASMKPLGINANLTGRTFWLVTADGGKVWSCTNGSAATAVDSKFLPHACR